MNEESACQSIRNVSFHVGQQWHENYPQEVFPGEKKKRCSREIIIGPTH